MVVSQSSLTKLFILANCCLVIGLLLNYVLPNVIDIYIDKEISLVPGSKSYPMWREPPVSIYQKFYFYNVTNANEVEQFGFKPQLQEVGPFTYRTDWSKRNIEADDLKSIISFETYKEWHFEPDLSIADHRLELVTLNAPLAITLSLIQNASNAIRLLVTFSLDGLSEGFFTRRTVRQLLFDGYPDLLTTFGPLLNAEMLSQGGHFGYMNARNASSDGRLEINTGQDDIGKLNTINKFNGRSRLHYWHNYHHSNHCNSLEGSTIGELFPPMKDAANDDDDDDDGSQGGAGKSAPQSIKLFQPDFCRVWRLDQAERVELANGLRLRRFRATRDVFRNASDLPENSCFFSGRAARHHRAASGAAGHQQAATERPMRPHTNRVGRQQQAQQAQTQQAQQSGAGNRPHHSRHHSRLRQEWPAGVFTLAPCKFNAPIYMSMPHFLDAEPYFSSQVQGLAPDRDKHDFFIDLEPRTGSPVAMSVRVQLNVAISKPPGIVRFRHVPEIMFPVFWQELSLNLSESASVMDQLLLASRGALELNARISYGFLVVGIVVLVATAALFFHARSTIKSAGLSDESLNSDSSITSTVSGSSRAPMCLDQRTTSTPKLTEAIKRRSC